MIFNIANGFYMMLMALCFVLVFLSGIGVAFSVGQKKKWSAVFFLLLFFFGFFAIGAMRP